MFKMSKEEMKNTIEDMKSVYPDGVSDFKVDVKCKCGKITEFSEPNSPISVTGRPKTIVDSNCVFCGREIIVFVSVQNEKNLFEAKKHGNASK